MRYSSMALLVGLGAILQLAATEQVPGWADQALPAWSSPVHSEAVVVEGETAIRWVPEAFSFEAGSSRRYIDFAAGDDASDGLSPATAWQRHPWDPEAGGVAAATSGVHTYVFKRGVVYRGQLIGRESGSAEEPIRLTCDPAWGDGPAVLAGSTAVTGWEAVTAEEASAAGIPAQSLGKVWAATVPGDFVPRAAWLLQGDGQRQRIPLARWPNWEIDHPFNHFSQWFRVEEADGERNTRWPRTTISAEVLKGYAPDAFDGATIWVNHASSGGMISIIGPYPSEASGYDPDKGSLRVPLTHPSRFPQPQSPFFLENLPRFLDRDNEWTFVPESRRIFLRLPGDLSPEVTVVEVARHQVVLDLVDLQHVVVSGLTITGGNAMNINRAPRGIEKRDDVYRRPDNYSVMAAIRLTGDVRHVRLQHLTVTDNAGCAVVNNIQRSEDRLEDIVIADSRFADIDNSGIHFARRVGPVHYPSGRVSNIRIVRNAMETIGLRCSVDQGGRGINVVGLEIGEIAGNVIHRTAAMGINVVGALGPLTRIQIHGNQVSEGLLHKNDFGNIEFWGNGPAYVYNNISKDPVGFFANYSSYHKAEAFYFDHGSKGFLFNNIAWSREWPEARHGVLGQTFFKEVRNRWNQAFHNTAFSFRTMQNMEGVNGQQQHYLANLFIQRHVSTSFFGHWGLETADGIGYARNVLAGPHGAVFGRDRGNSLRTAAAFEAAVAELGNHVTTDVPAWVTADQPVYDAEASDFRPTDDSAVIDRGVRVFVPWGLYGTVGEWFFRCEPGNPGRVLAHDLYWQNMYSGASVPDNIPPNDLIGPDFTVADYVPGILEDWNNGAVVFDGARALRLPQERLIQDIAKSRRNKDPVQVPGRERRTVRMSDNNFLIEAVLLAESGGGVVAGKMDSEVGYALELDDAGRPLLRLRGQDGTASSHTAADAVLDGRWHHLLAEVDRAAGTVTIYRNGVMQELVPAGQMPGAGVSLDNEADFVVGAGFHGALDYLRVCRGTLGDAQTDIATLMSWQFAGPQLHDFTGRPATGPSRDAGAIEHPSVSGRQAIHAPTADSWATEADPFTRLIAQPWKARLITELPSASKPQKGHDDPGISAAALAAVQLGLDDSSWDAYQPIPNRMWDGFAEVDGEAVFRMVVEVPEGWAGQDLELSLGALDDFDVTFWNGHALGETTIATPGFWEHPRRYRVPAELVRGGRALIAIRIFDRFGG
ncbi:MAG: hypothetical protein PF961_11995, partial [Planctomycetota bacterium]|nr:hypothetical protein [Planctomycetota bacterium]